MTFVIIDGHAEICRAIFKSVKGPRLHTRDGEITQGPYFFVRSLILLCKELKPEYLAIALDPRSRAGLARRKTWPDYKKRHHKKYDPDFVPQFRRCIEILEALGLCVLRDPEHEADDLIYSLVKSFAQSSRGDAIVVSPDKDLGPVLEFPRVSIYNSKSRAHVRRPDFEKRWNIRTPSQISDLLALAGDASDGIPGLRGIGPKTAVWYIQKYRSVERIAEIFRRDRTILPKRLAQAILQSTLSLEVLKELMTLKDVGCPFEERRMRFKRLRLERCRDLFRVLGFDSLLANEITESEMLVEFA